MPGARGANGVAAHGFVLHPPCAGVFRQQTLHLARERRRRDRLGHDPKLRTVLVPHGRCGAQRGDRVGPRPRPVFVEDRLRAVGVVQAENRGLREAVGRAAARGVKLVPLDFDRPAVAALDEEPGRVPAERHRGRVEPRRARNSSFRLPDVRQDLLARRARAPAPAASAAEALITARNSRRETASGGSVAPAGNSSNGTRASSVMNAPSAVAGRAVRLPLDPVFGHQFAAAARWSGGRCHAVLNTSLLGRTNRSGSR